MNTRLGAFAAVALLVAACLPPAGAVAPDAVEPSTSTATSTTTPYPNGLPEPPWRTQAPRAEDHPARIADTKPVLIHGARLLLGDGTEIQDGHVLLVDGRIASVGRGPGVAPPGARVVEAKGKTVTPGFIDTHSHMGVFPMPTAGAHDDGNEMTAATTPAVRTVDAIWPADPAFERALKGGTTTVQVLPGSANLIGGRATTVKLGWASTARELVFPGAPSGLKMACGENPKRVHGKGRKVAPLTRMGNLDGQRRAFLKARRLIDLWSQWRATEEARLDRWKQKQGDAAAKRDKLLVDRERCDRRLEPARCREELDKQVKALVVEPFEPTLPPDRDLDSEALAGALEGLVPVHVHCYRADDMSAMLALADEVGFQVRSFHHALEAYKIRGELARRNVSVSTWADWFGFKLEANDGIPENLALVHAAGGLAIVHTDSAEGVRRMNQEAAKGLWAGKHAGLAIEEADAIRWVTQNPAKALGIDAWVGTLEVGKDADVVLWNGNPFSVYTRAELVLVDGQVRHDATQPVAPWSDFEVQP